MNQGDKLYMEGKYREALDVYKKNDDYLGLYGRAKCMMELDATIKDIIFVIILAYIKEPEYLEPIGDLILYLNKKKKYKMAYLIGASIVSFTPPSNPKYPLNDIYYSYKIKLELGLAAYYGGFEFECFKRMYDLLKHTDIPLDIKYCCEKNQIFEVGKMASKQQEYPRAKIAQIMNNSLKTNIILTITSCKRLGLFKQTINSFINCNLDYRLISKWICIDDNSSEEDRAEILKLYPFFTFIYKPPQDRGHIKSLNIIVDYLQDNKDIEYVFHLEDDWTFIDESHYILDSLNILDSDVNIGQVLVNRNYTQDIDTTNIEISGGEMHTSKIGSVKYIKHVYYPANTLKHYTYNQTLPTFLNNTYWPHYSLRPSITRARVFRELGYFSDFYGHFENIYGLDYVKHGYYSVFLPNISCIHTGPKSGENTGIPNSYILNEQNQFKWSAPDPPEIEGFKFIAGKDIISSDSLDVEFPTIEELRKLATNPLIKVISTTGRYSIYTNKNCVTIYQPNKKFPYKTGIYNRKSNSPDSYYRFLTNIYEVQLAEEALMECVNIYKFYGAALRICNLIITKSKPNNIRLLQNREQITKLLTSSDLCTELVEYKQPKNLVWIANDLLGDTTHDAFFINSPNKTVSDIKMQYIKYNDFYPDWQILILADGMILNKSAALQIIQHNITTKIQLLKSDVKIIYMI